MSAQHGVAAVSGRTYHRTKVTVYLTDEELLALDSTVLELRRRYGVKVDRGRYVREAIFSSSLLKIAERVRGGR